MFNISLATACDEISTSQFWNSVLLYHNRPHLVNRKIIATVPIAFVNINFCNDDIKSLNDIFTRSAILYEVRKLKELSKEFVSTELLHNILEVYDKKVKLQESTLDNFIHSEDDTFVSLRILLPKQNIEKCIEIVILDKKHKVATFFASTEINQKAFVPTFAYEIQHVSGTLRICVKDFEDAESCSADWLCDRLFSKLIKWVNNSASDVPSIQSLALVCVETYTVLYQDLKNKYGKKIIEIWQENTDPLKYIYEDIAIAAYLISLWQQTNPGSKVKFVDLGCGNGLLVHILNEEGYKGFGIDVRKRKIWDWYPKTTILKVQTITPSAKFLFPDVDWIIGNHSDELSPWVPIITARSSWQTNFFLLPCCCYEFDGSKYKRKNTAVSTYSDYLTYIQEICNECGFISKIDKLRIPSTKRTCIVSFGRNYTSSSYSSIDNRIMAVIGKNCQISGNNDDVWLSNIQTRSPIEKVRNCTQINKDVIAKIIYKISLLLLSKQNCIAKYDGEPWNKGSKFSLCSIAHSIEKDDLKNLKKECGGLQTLIKNHRYIFEIHEGAVNLRIPSKLEMIGNKYKNKPCWFYKFHPDGCLNDNQTCAYHH